VHDTRAISAISNPLDFQDRVMYGTAMVELMQKKIPMIDSALLHHYHYLGKKL
tara:strand:+ start:934 stop:1092 length:159 start_codon:yes stop_codon:yes gene_type:complete